MSRKEESGTGPTNEREGPSLDAESAIVTLLSRWLARHLDNAQLREEIEAAGCEGLSPGQAEALDELLAELGRAGPDERGDVEVAVRETLESLALG